MEKNKQQKNVMPSFYKRFNIEIPVDVAKQRFYNRLRNQLPGIVNQTAQQELFYQLCNKLGIRFGGHSRIEHFLTDDLNECLHAIEEVYQLIHNPYKRNLANTVESIIAESEIDIGLQWRDGVFWPSGAKLLDEALVNENLKWLSDPKYADVLTPFEKGLKHLLKAQKQPEKLSGTITDMYEAMEKMARITNGNNKTLGANAKQFISNLDLSEYFETMLKEYTKYAHEFRHAVEQGKERVPPTAQEVEAFVYTTGLFIRLSIQRLDTK